jgi:acetylornithine deacetylase/succinyl-diaminopimelate desuccinylase-like protein
MNSVVERIRLDRITEDLWQLVNIPSPTRNERDAALAFAGMLRQAGARVEVDETIPSSPSVIGRLSGKRPGRTFQLAGHIDHIDVPHAPPARDAKFIHARGAADMKNGLAGILETVRVLAESGCDFPGEVLVTVYGLHEAPLGDSATLLNLMSKGIVGQAALVAENSHSADGTLVLAGKGQSVWNITVRRTGEVCHELNYPQQAPDFFQACLAVGRALNDQSAKVARSGTAADGLLSAESLFTGQMHFGDFYNRVPATCTMQGTRRWHPDKRLADIRKEMDALLAAVPLPAGVTVSCDWLFVGESYVVDGKDPLVGALCRAIQRITGKTPPHRGVSVVTDANRLAPLGGVPAILLGFDNEFAHADDEYIRIDRLLEPCQVMVTTVLEYLNA